MFRSASVPHSTRKDGKLAVNYNYNHNNLPFSHKMIIVIISDEDKVFLKVSQNSQESTCARVFFLK